MTTPRDPFLSAAIETAAGYRRMIDAAVAQLSDDELFAAPDEGFNSVALLLRHLGGNLASRWTDFLTTDGEKPWRDRDSEFELPERDRAAVLAHFEAGWTRFIESLEALTPDDLARSVEIRGEAHSVPLAITRSLTHVAYHTGQLMMVARSAHVGAWRWLTIPPGGSRAHNETTWGTAKSRGVSGGAS